MVTRSARAAAELPILAESFRRTLLAENKSPATIVKYGRALRLFDSYLAAQGMPRTLTAVRREHVESFVADLLTRSTPGTAANRYRALQTFFKLCGRGGTEDLADGQFEAPPRYRRPRPTCSAMTSCAICSRPARG